MPAFLPTAGMTVGKPSVRTERRAGRESFEKRSDSSSEGSMLFDMDMGTSPTENGAQSSLMADVTSSATQMNSSGAGCSRGSFCAPSVASLAEEVQCLLLGDQENGSMSAIDLARHLALKGYHSKVMLERSRYSKYSLKGPVVPFRPFMLVTGHTDTDGSFTDLHLIVDPAFRAKFQVAQPSSKYAAMISALQEAFVGDPEELKSLVTTLAGSLKSEFMARGMALPPWRSAVSLLSIWFPLDGRRFMCATPDECGL